MTTDVDAIIRANSSMKDAINRVGNQHSLPNGWLNADFIRTLSYSPKLVEVAAYYRTFSNVLTVRAIMAEYLIAMKLRSGRKYKYDLSDIIGIMAEHEKNGQPITKEAVNAAVRTLYGNWEEIPIDAKEFLNTPSRCVT